MLFRTLVDTSQAIAGTSKRLQKTGLLAALLKQLHPDEIEIAVAFLSGGARQGRIGIGYATVREAQASPTAQATLTLVDVDRALADLAAVAGRGSEVRRRELLHDLFARCTEPEQRFLFGLLTGEIRQGALEGIMLDALASASSVQPERVRRAAMLAGSINRIAPALLTEGEPGLTQFDLQLFCPVQPMLAQSAEDISEAIEELGGQAALEYKFDGARVQVHKDGDHVAVYSRASNDVSAAIPEVVESIRKLPVQNLILDGEVLSLFDNGRPRPFQTSMRRFGRKVNVAELLHEVPMTPFWFDILYLNGTPVLDEAQEKRFATLRQLVPSNHVVPHLLATNREEAEAFTTQAIDAGHEGVMAKLPSAPYAAGARGQSWLKVKQARTLDLVILAAEWGNGRRQGFLSNLHLGARDLQGGGFAMLGKTFKGLTDEMLAWQTAELLKLEIARDAYTVFVEPKLVAEIAFNEIQISSRYKSGLALRFARVKRYRTDKAAADVDTFQTVQTLAGSS